MYFVGDQRAPQVFNFGEHHLRDLHRIGTLSLCQGYRYRRIFRSEHRPAIRYATKAHAHIFFGHFRAVRDLGDLAQVNRLILITAHHEVTNVFFGLQEFARGDEKFAVVFVVSTRTELMVVGVDHSRQVQKVDVAFSHLILVQDHAQLSVAATYTFSDGHVLDFIHFVGQFLSYLAKLIIVVILTPQRQGQHGYIVDSPRFHQRHGNSARHHIHVFAYLVVEIDKGSLDVFTHIKLHYYHSAFAR